MVGVPLLTLLNDSRWNSSGYTCEGGRSFTLQANSPGNLHWGEIRVDGSVFRGSASISGFPVDEPTQTFTAGSSVSMLYASELYEPVDIAMRASPGAQCDLRITYRLKSDLSLLNPLW